MKIAINYKRLRRITFSIYILLSVLFCALLIYIGKEETEKSKLYAEQTKEYLKRLLETRIKLNNLENIFNVILSQKIPFPEQILEGSPT